MRWDYELCAACWDAYEGCEEKCGNAKLVIEVGSLNTLLEGYVAVPRKQLQEKLNRLEQPRAGSIFSSHMELGMMYVLRKLLGLDVSEIEAQALKWKKGVMEKYREKLRGDGKRPTK